MSVPVARSRISPPPGSPERDRPRLLERLDAIESPVVALVAGPGYGKTALVASWATRRQPPVVWASLVEGDEEPYQLAGLLLAAGQASGLELDEAHEWLEKGQPRWALDALLNRLADAPRRLVLDDAHRPRDTELLQYLLDYLPPGSQAVLLTRTNLPAWKSLKLKRRLTVLGSRELAYSQAELSDPDQWERTGGWPLAVELGMEADSELPDLVLDELDPDDLRFLEQLSLLEFFTAAEAAELTGESERLARLAAQGPAVQPLAEGSFRLQPLFREPLLARLQSQSERYQAGRQRLAQSYLSRGLVLEALEWLEPEQARELVLQVAPELLRKGRHGKLLKLLEGHGSPGASLYRAHALRQQNDWQAALAEFARASKHDEHQLEALLGQARVYLDTVQPAAARGLLRQAYRLAPAEKRPEVLSMLAENAVNLGQNRAAARFRRWVARLEGRSPAGSLDARILLRSGQLPAALRSLEGPASSGEERPLTAHAEEQLVLAYVAAVMGDAETAERAATAVLEQARRGDSRQTRAVAWMRLGHARQVAGSNEAEAAYKRSLELAAELGVARLRVEALMGLALLYTGRQDTPRAYDCAAEGLAIASEAGDAWLAAWLRLVAGMAATRGGHPGAVELVRAARAELERCHDAFGSSLAQLWLEPSSSQARDRLRERGLGFVLERSCLFPPPAASPPRSELRVEVLGPMRVWRSGEEIPTRAFKRRKARELLAMLALAKGRPVGKEHLVDQLFPDSMPDAAERDFRVVLHNLTQVLEPDKPKGAASRAVTRREESYQLDLEAVSLDLAEFEQQSARGAAELIRGELLADYPYAEWLQAEREAVRVRSLRVLMESGEAALASGQATVAEELARRALELDPCLEEAYRLLMRVQLGSGHDYLARRIFEQCRQRLQQELGVDPEPATAALLEQLG